LIVVVVQWSDCLQTGDNSEMGQRCCGWFAKMTSLLVVSVDKQQVLDFFKMSQHDSDKIKIVFCVGTPHPFVSQGLVSWQSQISTTNSFAIVNCFSTIATAAKSNSIMEPPQPPNIETPFEQIMEAMNNVHAPFQPLTRQNKGETTNRNLALLCLMSLLLFSIVHLLDEYTLESIQQKDANGKLVIHTIFQEYVSFVKGPKQILCQHKCIAVTKVHAQTVCCIKVIFP
jgi:hypothetical protein